MQQYHCKRSFLAHKSQWPHGSWTSTWFLVTTQAADIHMTSNVNRESRLWHGLQWKKEGITGLSMAYSSSTDLKVDVLFFFS